MADKLAKRFLLLDHKINTEYLKYSKRAPKKVQAKDREELRLIIRTICKHIGKQIVERKAGVHIRKLGYFFVWKVPRKMTYSQFTKGGTTEERYNYHTDQHMYSPIFLPSLDARDSLKRWSMDNSFNVKVRRGISKMVRAGFKYKMYAYSIMRLNRI
jgi:hypothetical protein